MALAKEAKTETIGQYKTHATDTGSPEVQVALLTDSGAHRPVQERESTSSGGKHSQASAVGRSGGTRVYPAVSQSRPDRTGISAALSFLVQEHVRGGREGVSFPRCDRYAWCSYATSRLRHRALQTIRCPGRD